MRLKVDTPSDFDWRYFRRTGSYGPATGREIYIRMLRPSEVFVALKRPCGLAVSGCRTAGLTTRLGRFPHNPTIPYEAAP